MSRARTIERFFVTAAVVVCGCGPEVDELHTEQAAVLGGEVDGLAFHPATGFVSHHPGGPPNGRLCTATRIAWNVVLTAGHCVETNPVVSDYSFGFGDHTLKGARYEPALDIVKLSTTDLALLRIPGCTRSRPAEIVDHHGFDDQYTISSFLHTNNTRNGPMRALRNIPLTYASTSTHRVGTVVQCAYGSVWGGDSGSPLYDASSDVTDSPVEDRLIGVITSVGGFCQNGATSQSIFGVYLADPFVYDQIQAVVSAWSGAPSACAVSDG